MTHADFRPPLADRVIFCLGTLWFRYMALGQIGGCSARFQPEK